VSDISWLQPPLVRDEYCGRGAAMGSTVIATSMCAAGARGRRGPRPQENSDRPPPTGRPCHGSRAPGGLVARFSEHFFNRLRNDATYGPAASYRMEKQAAVESRQVPVRRRLQGGVRAAAPHLHAAVRARSSFMSASEPALTVALPGVIASTLRCSARGPSWGSGRMASSAPEATRSATSPAITPAHRILVGRRTRPSVRHPLPRPHALAGSVRRERVRAL
jgi:hypothetical protein